jgi:2-polyprenyl-3-methyl-5-hydroxy-6-metoxy-1,4-benzoquinol methylase
MQLGIIKLGIKNLGREEIYSKKVIEVGSYNVNGSLKPYIETLGPSKYVGVDIAKGPGVDRICTAEKLVKEFGIESFDVVVATEVLEHVRDWREAVSNIKKVCKKGGFILISAPSKGILYHGYPNDFWRYEIKDIESYPMVPGAFLKGSFLKCKKPKNFKENNLSDYCLYSIVVKRRAKNIKDKDLKRLRFSPSVILDKLGSIFPGKYVVNYAFKHQRKRASDYIRSNS